jgi:AraC family transcriptional regulator
LATVSLGGLAAGAGLSPHQAVRSLAMPRNRILDAALDCGFGDVSDFNHAFREEFRMSPLRFRKQLNQK